MVNHSTKYNYFKDQFIEMWIEDGILYHIYQPDLEITVPVAAHITLHRIEISEGKSWPLLTDARRLKSIDKKSRDYWSTGDGLRFLTAGAVIINGPVQSLLGNALIFLSKPTKPLKLFSNYDSALKWLEHYKRVN
jgi:hypothetical protein